MIEQCLEVRLRAFAEGRGIQVFKAALHTTLRNINIIKKKKIPEKPRIFFDVLK